MTFSLNTLLGLDASVALTIELDNANSHAPRQSKPVASKKSKRAINSLRRGKTVECRWETNVKDAMVMPPRRKLLERTISHPPVLERTISDPPVEQNRSRAMLLEHVVAEIEKLEQAMNALQ
jgi:hypothetical protein